MGSRDTSLLDRTREAEKMVRQSRSRAEQSENEARKLDQLSQAAQLRAKKAERRAFEAQETLTNVNRRLKGMIGPKNKWRYHQHGFRPPVSPSEQVIAHLDVLEAVIAEGLSADASCSLHPSPHSAPTVPPEVKRESVDHEHKLFEAVSARDTAESEVHTLTEKLATTEAQTTHMLHQIKEERDGAMSRLREAEGHVRDLQHELSQVKRDAATFETRLQGVNGLAAESAAKLKEAQKALSDTHSAFGHAVSRAEAAERDSRATQLALESLRAERESPIIVPALMDALRLIVQSAA
jgi:chromosome segregation ATPase